MSYGVFFFKGNGQVAPATASNYLPVCLELSNRTDANRVLSAFAALHPDRTWIVTDDKFVVVDYANAKWWR